MGEIVGRDGELDALARLLALEPDAPRVLLLEGEPGIGKTTVWRAGLELARERGFTVLACATAAPERELSFAALRDLLDGVFAEVADELPEPQRRALAVTLLLDDLPETPPEPGTIGTALLTALRTLGRPAPVVVAVDDAQWLDPASAAALSFAARRLADDRVALLLAQRAGEPGPLHLPPADEVEKIELAPLTVGALGHILHGELDVAPPRPTLRVLHEASGGNPFYALELARALDDPEKPIRPGDALPLPPSLDELVTGRIAALPAATLDALAAIALAGPSTRTLAALRPDLGEALEPARAAAVVELDGAAVRFVHPLFASAASELVPAARRREIHARLAEVVEDVEERARHLSLSTDGTDEAVAALVEEGARAAFARGSPAAAAALAARSRALTPPERQEEARRRALAEADFAFAAGDTGGAARVLAELAERSEPGPERARVRSRQARLRHFASDIAGSVELLRAALAEAGGDDALRGEVEEGLAWGLLLTRADLADAAAHARSAAALARARGDRAALAEGLAAQAVTSLVLGRPWEEAIEEALRHEEALLGLRVLRHPTFALGYCLGCADEVERARAVFEQLRERAERGGDESSMPSLLNHLTLVEAFAGRWAEAERHADEGFARARESGQTPTQVSILAKRALLDARRGSLEEAAATAGRALELAVGEGFDPAAPHTAMARGAETALWTLGFVELSAGRPEEAARLLVPMTSALLGAGVREPGELRALPDAVEALVGLERLDAAEELLTPYAESADRLARSSARAVAGRLRGLVAAARGEGGAALAELERAAALHEAQPLPFDRARTLLALGTVQRRARQRRAARASLERAAELFDGLGAGGWAERCRAELGRLGGRAPSRGALTPSERRIAELVAEGRTNGEVAATLVLSVHTVEAALTSVYRKLDVRSRTEMARKLDGAG